jgi:hypothetical protein
MGQDVLSRHRPPEAEPELLIREARRRQRRRRLVTGLAVAAMLAGATGVVAGIGSRGQPPVSHPRPGPSAPATGRQALPGPIPHSVGTTVLMWPVGYPAFGTGLWPPAYLDNLSTGRLSRRHKLAFAGGDYRPYLVRTGRWLVYVGGQGAMAIGDDLKGRPRVLGSTPFFAPAAAPGHVWLERIRGDLGEGGQASVWLVSVRTGRGGPVITLPRNASLVAGTDAGLLLEALRGQDFGLALWRPGGAPRALPYSPWSRDGLDASPRLVAYGTGCQDLDTVKYQGHTDQDYYEACPVLRVFDVVTGRLLSFRAPPGTAGWMPLDIRVIHAIAPGGRMIAAYAATRPLGHGHDRLFVMRLTGATGPPLAVPSSAAVLYPRTAWSADGSWLFYQGPRGRLWAYQVSGGKVGASSTPCCPYTVMAAFPSGRR